MLRRVVLRELLGKRGEPVRWLAIKRSPSEPEWAVLHPTKVVGVRLASSRPDHYEAGTPATWWGPIRFQNYIVLCVAALNGLAAVSSGTPASNLRDWNRLETVRFENGSLKEGRCDNWLVWGGSRDAGCKPWRLFLDVLVPSKHKIGLVAERRRESGWP